MAHHKGIRNRANPYGICRHPCCRLGRKAARGRSAAVGRLKKRMRLWQSNKYPKAGIHFD